MRRNHQGYNYEPVPSTSSSYLEEENEKKINQLGQQIHTLKQITVEIGNEVKYHDKLLRDMDEDFERTSGSLTATVSRVIRMAKGRHNYHIFYIFLFSLAVFIVLWILLKFK